MMLAERLWQLLCVFFVVLRTGEWQGSCFGRETPQGSPSVGRETPQPILDFVAFHPLPEWSLWLCIGHFDVVQYYPSTILEFMVIVDFSQYSLIEVCRWWIILFKFIRISAYKIIPDDSAVPDSTMNPHLWINRFDLPADAAPQNGLKENCRFCGELCTDPLLHTSLMLVSQR